MSSMWKSLGQSSHGPMMVRTWSDLGPGRIVAAMGVVLCRSDDGLIAAVFRGMSNTCEVSGDQVEPWDVNSDA